MLLYTAPRPETGVKVDAVHMIGVVDVRVEEVGTFELGVAVSIDRPEDVADIQADGESFADFEGIAPVKLVQTSLATVYIGDITNIFDVFDSFDVVADVAERLDSDAGAPVPRDRQTDGQISGFGVGVALGHLPLAQMGGIDGRGGVGNERERVEGRVGGRVSEIDVIGVLHGIGYPTHGVQNSV